MMVACLKDLQDVPTMDDVDENAWDAEEFDTMTHPQSSMHRREDRPQSNERAVRRVIRRGEAYGAQKRL